jgi:two-component system chemotaxis response regulator CheY
VNEYRLRQFQVVLMDLTMPGIDGLQAFHEIRALDPDARVILCSGYGDFENDCHLSAEFDRPVAFLPKPYPVRHLMKVLREAVHFAA